MPPDPAAGEEWVGYRGRVHIAGKAIDDQIDGCSAWYDQYQADAVKGLTKHGGTK